MANKEDPSFEDNDEESFPDEDNTPGDRATPSTADSSLGKTGWRWPTKSSSGKKKVSVVEPSTGKTPEKKKSVMAETLALSMMGRSPEVAAH